MSWNISPKVCEDYPLVNIQKTHGKIAIFSSWIYPSKMVIVHSYIAIYVDLPIKHVNVHSYVNVYQRTRLSPKDRQEITIGQTIPSHGWKPWHCFTHMKSHLYPIKSPLVKSYSRD